MSNDQPTNGELAIMLKNIELKLVELHNEIRNTADKVNKNTEFRLKQQGVYGLLRYLGVANLAGIIYLFVK